MDKIAPSLQSSIGRSKAWGGARLVNAFAEVGEGDKRERFAVMAIPGLVEFCSIGADAIRGSVVLNNVLYVVAGSTLYSVNSAGIETALGTVAGDKPVKMVASDTEIAIHGGVNEDTGYVFSGGTVHTAIPNLGQVSDVAYIDGYFVWTLFESEQFIISGNGDGLTYDPLDVASVEGAPGKLVSVINDHRELHLPKTTTWEIWYNSGDVDFPFERQGNAFIERGCIDRNSIVKIDNSLHFVGDDRIVYRLSGYDPIRISTHAIETKIAAASWFRGFTYTEEGHKHYVLNTDVGTFSYDMATGLWHERISYQKDYYRVANAARVYDKTIMGDAFTGKLYYPSLDAHTENGDVIPVQIDLPTIEGNRRFLTMYCLEAYVESGVGNAQDSDPQMIMQYSKDGGRTFGIEQWRPLGAVGEYLTRAVWRPKVQFRQLQIRFKMPSKTRRFVISYTADVR